MSVEKISASLQAQSTATSNSKDPLRVLIYSRVSDPQQVRRGYSLEAQPIDLRSWAKTQGWIVVDELSDAGRSGRTADREGFQSLMEELRSRRPDAVLVTRLSRFMRNARNALNAVHEMRELGVALICKDEPINTQHRGISDMFLAILATMAEWESDQKSEYSRETHRRLVSRGRWPGGSAPFGYAIDKPSGGLVIDPDRAEIVRLVFRLYTEKRMGVGAIRAEFSRRAINAPRGGKVWSVSVLLQILTDPVYTGQHRLGILAEPIIEKTAFERAQQLRKENTTLHPPRKDPWPLQNRLICTNCGSKLRTRYSHGRRYYVCPNTRSDSRRFLATGIRCTTKSLRAPELEQRLWESLSKAVSEPEELAVVLERAITELDAREVDLGHDVKPLRERLEQVNGELERLELAWIKGHVSADKLESLERDVLRDKGELEKRIEALDPGRVDELHMTQARLRVARDYLEAVTERRSTDFSHLVKVVDWDGQPVEIAEGAPSVTLEPIPSDPAEALAQLVGDWLLIPGWKDRAPGTAEPERRTAWCLSQALDRLQADVWAFDDKIEIRGALRLNMSSSSECQAFGNGTRTDRRR